MIEWWQAIIWYALGCLAGSFLIVAWLEWRDRRSAARCRCEQPVLSPDWKRAEETQAALKAANRPRR